MDFRKIRNVLNPDLGQWCLKGSDDVKIDRPPSQSWLTEHGPRLVLMARQWVPCHADAEDIVQTAFVRFWKHADSARDPIAYLYRIVRNTAMNHYRSTARRKQHEDAAASQPQRREPMFVDPVARVEQAELGEQVTDALDTLPIEQREVVVMRVWGQLSFDAIGEATEVPARTAQSRYRYGIGALRRTMSAVEGAAQ